MTRFRAGSVTVDITPDRPVPMSGYSARTSPSSGVHDSLSATALVVSDGATVVGIVSLDVLAVSRAVTANVHRRLERTDVAIDELFLTATHTHCGPYIPAETIEVTPGLAIDEDVSDTVELIERKCVESLVNAYERLEPATLSIGTARNDTTPINRRAADGRGRIPTGGIDPELIVLDVQTTSGEETVVFNFPLHPVCLPPSETRLSTDWPGVVYEHVGDTREATVLFLNGAAGDINPRGRMDTARTGADAASYRNAVGMEIADTVLTALEAADDAPDRSKLPIVTDRHDLRLPVKNLGEPETLRRHIRELDEKLDQLTDESEIVRNHLQTDRRYAAQLLRLAEWEVTELPATLQYIGLGNIGVVGVPGEAFVEHGLDFKARAASDTLLIAGYANGYVGYLPTLKEFENFGYEIWTTKVAPEAVGQFRDAGTNLISNN